MATSTPIYLKDPVEVRDFDLQFSDELTAHSDTAAGLVGASADTGLTINSVELLPSGDVRVFTSGGISGRVYRLVADIVTAGGRLWREQIWVRVRGAQPTGPVITSGGFLYLDGFALLLDPDFLVLSGVAALAIGGSSLLLLDSVALLLDSNLLVLT